MDIENSSNQKQKILPSKRGHKIVIGTSLLLAVVCLTLFFLLKLNALTVLGRSKPAILKIALAGFCIFTVLTISTWIEKIITRRSHTKAIRYNMVRVVRLLSVLAMLLIIVSFVYQNWYTAAVSLGLFSLILGFALQTPISSLIGWIYIVFRLPYKVGDRIQIDNFTGDVVEIGYLDTTLWEFGGNYLTSDIPSGRLIRFPNSLILQSAVFNYSWKKFPFIWNEIPFHVAYESDLDFVTAKIKSVASEIIGDKTKDEVVLIKEYLRETAIDELEIKDYPFVNLRINTNTWVEVLLVYLVEPKKASAVRTTLIRAVLKALLAEPSRAMFPNSNAR